MDFRAHGHVIRDKMQGRASITMPTNDKYRNKAVNLLKKREAEEGCPPPLAAMY